MRNIRNNFREVFFKACSARLNIIHEKKQELGLNIDSYGDEEYARISSELSKKCDTIERSRRSSILLCPVCGQIDKDMIFNPIQKKWYCTECYKILQSDTEEGGVSKDFP